MSNIDKQALRERYSLQPVPKCHICDTVMTIARASAGAVMYACSGCTYDDNGAHYAPGRSLGDDHYSASRVTIFESGDSDVLALLDELETKEEQRANWFQMAQKLGEDLDAAEKRIAELEARKFKVEMPESFYPDGDIDAPLVVDELEVIAAIVEAGGKPVAFCKRCDREIDLTHRPDGSHYCHAPAADIGVKGE